MAGYVTINGVTRCQPGITLSTTSPASFETGGVRLNVSRLYHDIRNAHGGLGKFKKCDGDGLVFA